MSLECCRKHETKRIITLDRRRLSMAIRSTCRSPRITRSIRSTPTAPASTTSSTTSRSTSATSASPTPCCGTPTSTVERQEPQRRGWRGRDFRGKDAQGETPVVNGAGDQERDFVHVFDVARASVLALDRADGQIINLGSGVGTSVTTIVKCAGQTPPATKAPSSTARPSSAKSTGFSSSPAQLRSCWAGSPEDNGQEGIEPPSRTSAAAWASPRSVAVSAS